MQPSLQPQFTSQYLASLQSHWKKGPLVGLEAAHAIGTEAVAMGLDTLELARLHQHTLSIASLPSWSATTRDIMTNRATLFFNTVISHVEQTHPAQLKPTLALKETQEALKQRTLQLTRSRASLRTGKAASKQVNQSLKTNQRRLIRLLKKSNQLALKLKHARHQILSATEHQRLKISLELQSEVSQTLLGINFRLHALKKQALAGTTSIATQIATNQRLILRSLKSLLLSIP